MLRLPEWENWLSGKHPDRSLWIHGPPGTGKTVLASFLIEQIQHHCDHSPSGSRMGCAYYYCHYSHDQDECGPFLSWTLSQAGRQTRYLPGRLKRMYDRGCEPSIPELESALELVLEQLDVLYVVVDAIDESNPRSELVNLIATLVLDTRFRKIRILTTSRPYFEIERVFGAIFGSVVSMSNAAVKTDIRKMVNSRLASSYRLRRWRDEHQRIEDLLVAKSDGMFQWAELQLRKIERLRDISQLEETLQNLPVDLAETYTRILSAISPQDREYVRRVLIWVIGHSKAAWLTSNGINAELLVSAADYDLYGNRKESSSNEIDRSFDVEHLRELCDCLLTFKCVSSEEPDDGSMTSSTATLVDDAGVGSTLSKKTVYRVSVSHYTVVEFLESSYILSNPSVSYFSLSQGVIRYEFATSVFRQAIEANPDFDGTSPTDWETDREAYCLTLGCTLGIWQLDMFEPDVEFSEADHLAELALQYYSPSNPHFSRFRGIQRRIATDPRASDSFYLASLPSRFDDLIVEDESILQADYSSAKTLLCILSVPTTYTHGKFIRRCVQRLLKSCGRDYDELMNTRVSGYRTVGGSHVDWDEDESQYGVAGFEDDGQIEYYEQAFEGTVRECRFP